MKHVCYIGDSSYESFLEGRQIKLWAGNKNSNFETMQKGDILYFLVKIKSLESSWKPGFPRVKDIKELKGYFKEVVKVELTSNPKKALNPKYGSAYPFEIGFKEIKQKENIETRSINPIVLETIRIAITSKKIQSFESEWDI